MDAEDAELVVETAAAPAATTVDQVNVPDSEISDFELTLTSPAAVMNTLEGLVPQQVIESAEVKHKRAVTMQQFTVTQCIVSDSAFVLAHCNHWSARLSKRKGTLGKAGTTNLTRLGEHLESCLACPEDIRKQSSGTSARAAKKHGRQVALWHQ